MEEFSVVGKRIPRVEGYDKVTGMALYVADIKLPNMLYGKVLRSPIPHAKILHVDTEKAKRLPGVRAVITGEDTPKVKWGAFINDMHVLAFDKVRFVGDEVAAVAAVDEATAEEALDLIKVDYEELPAVFDPFKAMEPGAPIIHDGGNIALHRKFVKGDFERAMKEAAYVFEDKFTTPIVWHAYLETMGALATYSLSGKLTIWLSTQTLFMGRQRIARALGMRISDVRLIQPNVGGGFGGKSCDEPLAMICGLLAKKAMRPVRLINTREEEFQASRPRVATNIHLKMGFHKDGTIAFKDARVVNDNGAYSAKAPATTGVTLTRIDTLYRFKNVRGEAHLVYTNKVPTGAFRGFGNPPMHFAVEQMMDMGAEAIGIDPTEIRLRNATQVGDVSIHGWRVNGCALSDSIKKAAEMMNWKEERANKKPYQGYGMGCFMHVSGKRHFGNYDGSSAVIKINEDGKATIFSGEGEIGQGAFTVLSQIAAEELGVPIKDVEISVADTDSTTYCHGAYASRVTYIAGNAVKAASADAKKQLFKIASEMLEADPDDLVSKDAKIFVKGNPSKAVTVSDVARGCLYREGGFPIIGKGAWDPPTELETKDTMDGNSTGAYSFGTQMCKVEVDPETGKVKVLNFVAAHDSGKVINPMLAEGQIEGALQQGIGYALCEEMSFEDGKVMNPNFADYKILAADDMPEKIKIQFVETCMEPTGPFGAKGLGEPGLVPTSPAIANAIYNAIGVRIKSLPMTPEKILNAIKEKNKTVK
ncbi:MAG: xanthine dehydrogenase family protein molybdopterin-binding subunit [Thermodesulfobacteriota bacterium]|nr:xanthine dehydrogenase family protein molybdopterin-binding subunit [Thermodesulfobacteriota bacterium]